MAMNEHEEFVYRPRAPKLDEIDPHQVSFLYDETTDTLMVYLCGRDHPAISVDVDDYAYLRLDPTTEEIVGLQVEDYLARAVFADPTLLVFAEPAGIPAEAVEVVRRALPPDIQRRGAINTLLEHFARIPV